jgi:elongation factor P
MINGNQVRVGNVLEYKGKLVVVRRAQAVKPGKGGAFNQVELKDIRTGTCQGWSVGRGGGGVKEEYRSKKLICKGKAKREVWRVSARRGKDNRGWEAGGKRASKQDPGSTTCVLPATHHDLPPPTHFIPTTGLKYHERLRSSESVEKVRLDDEQPYDYLYDEGDKLILMNKEDFTQVEVSKDMLSENEQKFLEEGLTLRVQLYEGSPLLVRLPKTMVVEVVSTEQFSKGNQASPTFKPATLGNGEIIKVPPFVEVGEKVVIDTEEMEYQSRV